MLNKMSSFKLKNILLFVTIAPVLFSLPPLIITCTKASIKEKNESKPKVNQKENNYQLVNLLEDAMKKIENIKKDPTAYRITCSYELIIPPYSNKHVDKYLIRSIQTKVYYNSYRKAPTTYVENFDTQEISNATTAECKIIFNQTEKETLTHIFKKNSDGTKRIKKIKNIFKPSSKKA